MENHLTNAGGQAFYYDALGRMYHDVNGSNAGVVFLYAGETMIGEYDAASNALLRRYIPGPNDEPAAWYEMSSGATDRRWLVSDHKGSIIAVANTAGTVTSINSYDEAGIPGAGNVGRFQWDGEPWFSDIGLYHLRARTYSPTLGRFLQTDPIQYQDGMGWYACAHDDPVDKSDPSGETDFDWKKLGEVLQHRNPAVRAALPGWCEGLMLRS